MRAIIVFYSNNHSKFSYEPRYIYNVKRLALNRTKDNFTVFKNKVKYNGSREKYEIDLRTIRYGKNSPSCNCKNYLKWAICVHLVAYSNNFDLHLYDPKYEKYVKGEENFAFKDKRGAKKKYKKAEKALVRA